jgi:hypothetical protein
MRRHTRSQTDHPHHWPVHRSGTHIPAAPVTDAVAVAETSPAPNDTTEYAELATLPWIGLYYATDGT